MQVLRRSIAAIVACAVFLVSGVTSVRAELATGPLDELHTRLASFTSRAPGHVALFVKDLTTGLSTGINAAANMPAASTIKIPVMVEVFRQMAAGTFDLNHEVTLRSSDRDWGWGDLANVRPGTRYSVSRLLWLMITESDNTATNMLMRLVGRTNINATMLRLGLRQTVVGDYIRSDGDIRSLRTSPADMAHLLSSMAHDDLVDEWSSREMIAILTGQHHNGLLPEPLPIGTQVAHKTGTLHDTLNDVGIVFLGSEPYIIAVMTTHLPTLDAGRQFIRGVSRLAYQSFGKFAHRVLAPTQTPAPDLQMWSSPDDSAAPVDDTLSVPTPSPSSDPTPP